MISAISGHTPFSTFSNYTAQAEKNSPSSGKNDVVTLSDEGKKMQAKASANSSYLLSSRDNFMDGAGKDGVITLDEIRAYGKKYFKQAENILAETLKELNIPPDISMTISTDEKGVVKVESDLSTQDNDRLETALNEHPDFQQAYTKASSSQTLVDAAEKHLEFAKAYAKDPKAAVAQYGIGNSSLEGYVLTYAQGQARLVAQNRFSLMG